jgi:predicted phage tail component-like protein
MLQGQEVDFMLYGLTFNGKHSYKDFGLIMYSKNRPLLPEPKITTEDMPGMDGEYDYSAVNPDKEIKYKPREIEIEFTLKEPNLRLLRIKANKIAAWLACGEQKLIFDDEEDKYYLAKVANKLDLENQIVSIKRFTVQFRCRPFKFGLYYEGADIWDAFNFEEDVSQVTEFDVTGSKIVTIINVGRKVMPTINANANMSITIGSSTYNLISGDNVFYDLKFINGNNQITINGTGHIKFIFRKELL